MKDNIILLSLQFFYFFASRKMSMYTDLYLVSKSSQYKRDKNADIFVRPKRKHLTIKRTTVNYCIDHKKYKPIKHIWLNDTIYKQCKMLLSLGYISFQLALISSAPLLTGIPIRHAFVLTKFYSGFVFIMSDIQNM